MPLRRSPSSRQPESPREIDNFHLLLVKLPSRGILTTNYDPSLDRALLLADRRMTVDRFLVIEDDSTRHVSEFLASLNRDSDIPRRIAHLHGRYNRPRSIILTAGDYAEKYHSRFNKTQRQAIRDVFRDREVGPQGMSIEGLIDELESGVPPWSLHRKLLWSILAMRRIVFIGFSLDDPYLGQMLALVTDDLWRWKEEHHFAIMPLPDVNTAATKAAAERFRSKYDVGVVFYENRKGQHHEGLNDLIEEIAVTCAIPPEPLVVPPSASPDPVLASVQRPEWIDRNNQNMKKRALKDAD